MAGIVDRYKAWPKWARIAAPATVAVLAIGALGGGGGDASAKKTTTTTAEVVSLSDATGVAFDAADAAGLTKSQTGTLIQATCDAASTRDGADTLAAKLVDLQVDRDHLKPVLTALGDAAEKFCPTDVAGAPDLLNVAYASAVVLLDPSTTTTEATSTTLASTTTAASVTTAAPVTTKAPSTTKATTATTKAPTTTSAPSGGTVTPGAYCSPVGSTGYSSNGTQYTCATQGCDGTPYKDGRGHWRRTNC